MKHTLLPFIGLILLCSCTKENSTENNNTGNSTPPSAPAIETFKQFSVTQQKFAQPSKFLKREVSYFSSRPLFKYVRMFSYDAQNRCTEIKLGTIDSAQASPSFTLSQTLTFHYNDPATLLPASLSSVRTVFPNLVTEYYYKFNSEGLKIMDSVRVKNQSGQPADRTIHYVYDKNRVYVTPVLTGFPMDNVPLDTLDLLHAGNIEKLVSRSENANGVTITPYTFTYDQSISPYNKLNIANSLYFESSALGLGYNVPLETHYMGVTTNNMTSWSMGSYKVTFTYNYDKDGYPVKKQMFLPGDANPYQVSSFEY